MVSSTGLFLLSKMLYPWLQHHHHSQVQVPFLINRLPQFPVAVSLSWLQENQLWRRRMRCGDGRDGFLERPFGSFLQMSSTCSRVVFFLLSLKKTPLWKVSYEECSLFETSTTQTPILSRIESLAVHINTFQAQIKKCKQNKKIYIYIIFPLSKGFKSQCSKSFWTQTLRSTLFKQLGQTGPCKGYCL